MWHESLEPEIAVNGRRNLPFGPLKVTPANAARDALDLINTAARLHR
jgi:hypothetical protein